MVPVPFSITAPKTSASASSRHTNWDKLIAFISPFSIWSKTVSKVDEAGVVRSSSLYPCRAWNLVMRSWISTLLTALGTLDRLDSASALCRTVIRVEQLSQASTSAAISTMSLVASNCKTLAQKVRTDALSSATVLILDTLRTRATASFAWLVSLTSFTCRSPWKSGSKSLSATARRSGVSCPGCTGAAIAMKRQVRGLSSQCQLRWLLAQWNLRAVPTMTFHCDCFLFFWAHVPTERDATQTCQGWNASDANDLLPLCLSTLTDCCNWILMHCKWHYLYAVHLPMPMNAATTCHLYAFQHRPTTSIWCTAKSVYMPNECCNDLSPLCLPTPTDHFNLMHCKIRVHAEWMLQRPVTFMPSNTDRPLQFDALQNPCTCRMNAATTCHLYASQHWSTTSSWCTANDLSPLCLFNHDRQHYPWRPVQKASICVYIHKDI